MSTSSGWPLPSDGIRFFVPIFLSETLAINPLTRDLYPHGMGYYPNAKGHTMTRDEHTDHLLMYCLNGCGQLEVNNQTHSITPGDIMIIPEGYTHHYHADKDEPWTLYWVHFSGQLSDRYIDHIGLSSENPVIAIGRSAKLIADFETLMEVRQTGYQLNAFIHASNHLKQLISFLAVLIPKAKPQSGQHIDLDKVHALMQEKIYGKLDLDTIAANANLSKYHFSKKYKALTGNSAIQHFIHLKMERACFMLDISDKSIAEISQSLGYEDPHYFSRLFKKVIGMAPKDYRDLSRLRRG